MDSIITYFLASKLQTLLLMKNGCVHLLEAFHINLTMTKYKDIAKVIYLKILPITIFATDKKSISYNSEKIKLHTTRIPRIEKVYYLFFPKKIRQYQHFTVIKVFIYFDVHRLLHPFHYNSA